jgi:acetyl esterase/lipase
LGRTLRKKNITTVNINYTLYPIGTVEEMVLDVKRAVEWVKHNIHNYGGNPSKIYLLGHSAGAHLLAQYLCINSLSAQERECFPEYTNYFSNWKTSEMDSTQIAGFIGLSGVYDMDNHLVYEKKRGVEWISRMTQTMNGIEKFKTHSPMRQISKLKSVKLPKIYLRHGEYDGTVPYESTTLFYNELKKHSASDLFDVKVYPQMNHTDPIFNLMDDTYQHHSVLLEDILQIVNEGSVAAE